MARRAYDAGIEMLSIGMDARDPPVQLMHRAFRDADLRLLRHWPDDPTAKAFDKRLIYPRRHALNDGSSSIADAGAMRCSHCSTNTLTASRTQFDHDLQEKDWVIFIERAGTLLGFSTLAAYSTSVAGERLNVVCSGDTIVARPRGARWLFLVRGSNRFTAFAKVCRTED